MGDARHVSGTLSGAGVTDAREARLAESGLIAPLGPGALDVRTGVMAGPGSTTLVTGTSSTGPMTVSVGPHVAVTSRGSSNGVYLGPVLEAATTVTIAAAPGSGSRIDVVYVKQQDGGSGIPSPDATTAPLYGVLQGTASSSPAKPSLSSIVGAEELATVLVAAGATSTNGSGVTITNTARQTVARGGILPVVNSTARLAVSSSGGAYDGLVVVEQDTDRLYEWTGSAWQYVGGAPPPIVAVTLFNGWTAYSGHVPGVFKDASGLVKIVGCTLNGGSYNPQDGGNPTAHTILTLPTGYRPGALLEVPIACGSPAGPIVILAIGIDGVVQVVGGTGSTVGQNVGHWLDGIPAFHPAYVGAVPLS